MGVSEAGQPKRVRSSDFSAGATSGSNRRSRSTSKIPTITGPGLSSGKRQSSVSRLPMPGASKSRPGGRSSGGQMGLGTTPLNIGVNRPSSGRYMAALSSTRQHF